MFYMESRHLLNLSVQNALHCISENFNHKNFRRDACARNSLERCAVRCPDRRYSAHIATIYYISRHPLSQNPLSAPGSILLDSFILHGRRQKTVIACLYIHKSMPSNMAAHTNHTTLLNNQSAIKYLLYMRYLSNF